jgi:hypothetical protein
VTESHVTGHERSFLATGGADGVRLWKTASRRPFAAFGLHLDPRPRHRAPFPSSPPYESIRPFTRR